MQFADRSTKILWLILLSALSVRLLGIRFGLPHVFFPDEAVIVNHAMAFGTGDLNPHSFFYPSLYMYVMFVIYGITYVAGRLLGVFGSTADFIRLFFTDVTIFYLPGRLVAAFSGVASVWMVYRLGRRAYNAQVGLIAAAFLTFSVLHVSYSHFVKAHVPGGLFAIATVWLAWSIYEGRNSWGRYCLAGVTAGLAASTVYHGGFALVAVAVAYWLHSRNMGVLDGKLIAAAAASFAAFALTTPFALLDWPTFWSDLTASATMRYAGDFWLRGTFYPFTSLLTTFGQPLGAVALLGLGYALMRRRPADLIVASQPIFVGFFLMLFRVKESTHMLVAFPAISILAASCVADGAKWVSFGKMTAEKWAAATVSALLLLMPAWISVEASYRLSLPDTRFLAKAWVEANIPPESKIVMDSGKYYLGQFGPPLRLSRQTLEQLIRRGEKAASGNMTRREGTRRTGYAGEAEYFRYQLKALGDGQGYDIIRILHDVGSTDAQVLSLEQYLNEGVNYAIVSGDAQDSYVSGSGRDDSEKAKIYRDFYNSLREQARLLKEFNPSPDTAGPSLLIYALTSKDVNARQAFDR